LMRVKVKFPWLDDQLESDWCAVVLPAGVMATPSVNDQVAVVFEQGNFNRPYVLGELYSTASPGPSNSTNGTASGKVIQQIIKTENGHAMTFQDKTGQEKIAIASSDGQMKIEMDITNKKVTVQSAADVLVKATANMTLEATGSMTVKGATVKVEATGQMDLTATGVANLKGSMVNIN
nr:phage baseplate assembly protein V [Anaerolineae bacterium]